MKEKVKVLLDKVKPFLEKIGQKLDVVAQKLHLTRKQLLAIMGGFVALIAIVLWIIFGFDRVPKDALAIVNANKKSSITEAGFDADFWSKKKTLFSAKWDVDEIADFQIKNFPKDISEYDTLEFSVKLSSTDDARVMFYFGSENEDTEGADYYCFTSTLEAGGWNDVTFDMSKLVAYGEPLGLNKLTEISIRTKGWRNSAEEGSVIRFGNIYLTGDDVKIKTYNASTDLEGVYPHFTQDAIDDAAECAAKPSGWPRYDTGTGLDVHINSTAAEKCTNALYYLTLAVRYNEMEMAEDDEIEPLYASNGLLCKDAVIQLLEFFLQGGNEPAATPGCYWGHAVFANSLLLIKNTECIYNELSQDTKDRMDWMMKALAIAGNWGYNDANDYATGLDLCGNFGKTYNMNFQNSYLSIVLTNSLYFGNDVLNDIYVNFDYDTYLNQFREFDFINVIYTWETAGKALMETGKLADGTDPVLEDVYTGTTDGSQVGDAAGSGKGVKIPFKYTANMPNGKNEVLTLDDEEFAQKMFMYLASKTYSLKIVSAFGEKGADDYCFILGDVTGTKLNEETKEEENVYDVRKSPYEGRLGMFCEFKATDGYGIRSSLVYAYDSFEILTSVYTNMKLFGGWDSSTEDMQTLDEQIWVGNEDLLFRMEYGYRSYSNGEASYQTEQTFATRGIWYVKDIWKNVICDWEANTKLKEDINNPTIVDLPDAGPMGGVFEAPKGALASKSLYNSTFVEESYTSIGRHTTGKVAFDMVIGPEVTDKYDAVVAIMSKGEKETWANMEMSIQLQSQLVNIRSGSSYARTGFQFEANYRFHTEISFDASNRVYSAKIYQIYPTVGEVYECKDIPFRSSGDIRGYVDAIAVMQQNNESELWLENVYVDGKLVKGTDIYYADSAGGEVIDDTPADTVLRVHRDVWREFTDFTKVNKVQHVKRETVVLSAKDKLSDLDSIAYFVSKSPLSEAAVKKVSDWKEATHDVDCFKLEPYTKYYIYVKSVDSEGNTGYVSQCVMLDPDIPKLSGVVSGKTYCIAQTMKVSDKYLTSVTVNDEEIINKLSSGSYTLEKNSGKLVIVATDKAGNTSKATVRLSDKVLTDKMIVDSEDMSTITDTGWTVEKENTFNGGTYAAKWNVTTSSKNINSGSGDLSNYTKLKMAVKIAPQNKAKNASFLVFFGGENNAADQLQYYKRLLTLSTNEWHEITIDLASMTRVRAVTWDDIRNMRFYAYSWTDTDIARGSKIYIGYMYLEADKEDRVHDPNHTYNCVLNEEDTTMHDYVYSCCNTVKKTEKHTKAADSDKCSGCGQDLNTTLTVSNGSKTWNTFLSEEDGKTTYYTNSKDFTISAQDYGFGVSKVEYATSSTYKTEAEMGSLTWKTVQNGTTVTLDLKGDGTGLYLYARVTDGSGKVIYVSVNPAVYDAVAPTISGVENGVTYCEPPTITVSDTYFSKLTVGGTQVTLTNNQYTFEENCGTKEVVATDKAGNATKYIITVSDKILADKLVAENTKFEVTGGVKDFYFVDSSSGKGTNISAYKTLAFRMKVSEAKGTTATKMRLQLALWSHTYFEWTVTVTPNKWQTVSIDLHNPNIVSGSMKLSNVRFFRVIPIDYEGGADVAEGSTIALESMYLYEERVHGDISQKAYVKVDSQKHNITYACCNTVLGTEKHTHGSDGKCIKCTPPELIGVKDGVTYCSAPSFTVKDNNKLKYVKVNGQQVVLDDNNTYRLPDGNKEYTIEAVDEYNCKTRANIRVFSTAVPTVFEGFTDFKHNYVGGSKAKELNKISDLGWVLSSYKTIKFNMKVTSDVLANGTEVNFYLKLNCGTDLFFIYKQVVKVGETAQISFDLNDYSTKKGDPSILNTKSVIFDGSYANTDIQHCTIQVSDIKLTGLKEVRQHAYNQEIMDDAYRVNANEKQTCINGIHYYKSCVCGGKSNETFEGPKGDTHAKAATYVVNKDNVKQHIKTYACCGEQVIEGHRTAATTNVGDTTTCKHCGASYVDYHDYTAPTISGVEDGQLYDGYPTMVVTDDIALSKVTVNGVALEIVNGSVKYQFLRSANPYKIVAVDESGNQTTYTITVSKEVLFSTDFENSSLLTGWTDYSVVGGVTGSKYNTYTEDQNKALEITTYNQYTASPRVMKDIDVSKLDNLTVQFDYKTSDHKADFYFCHYNYNMTEKRPWGSLISNVDEFWGETTESSEWQTVKIEFTVNDGGKSVTGSAYKLVDGNWQALSDWQKITHSTDNGIFHAAFLTDLNAGKSVYLDNVEMYTIMGEDDIAPNILGVQDGMVYLPEENATMYVADSDLTSVKVNGVTIDIDKDTVLPSATCTFSMVGKYEIIATDKSGNETKCTILVAKKNAVLSKDFEDGVLLQGWDAYSKADVTTGSKYVLFKEDDNQALQVTRFNNYSANPRLVKEIDVSDLGSLIIQFDYKATANADIHFCHYDSDTYSLGVKKPWETLDELSIFWSDTTRPSEWQTVKLVFAVNENGATVSGTAYKLVDGNWEKVNDEPITCATKEGKFYATFLSVLGSGKAANDESVYLDNIEMYGAINEAYMAPNITGIVDGTYYSLEDNVTMQVSDNDLKSVTVNDKAVEIDSTTIIPMATYTFNKAGTYKIVATDAEEHTTTYTIKVVQKVELLVENFETGEWKDRWKYTETKDGTTATNARFEISNEEASGNKLLKAKAVNGQAYPRLMANINVSEYDNLTVQFNYRTNHDYAKLYFCHYDPVKYPINGKKPWEKVSDLDLFWTATTLKTPTVWQTVKIEFTVSENGALVSGTAYELQADGTWKQVEQPKEYDTDNGVLHATFLSDCAAQKDNNYKEVHLDNIEIYGIINEAERPPRITGIVNGEKHRLEDNPTMQVSDNDLKSVTVNGETITIDNITTSPVATYTFNKAGTYTIVATDAEEHTTTYTIKVVQKEVLLAKDFEDGELFKGWTAYSKVNSTTGSKYVLVTEGTNQVLKVTHIDTKSANPRLVKEIDVSRYDNVTVQFDYKTTAYADFYFCHYDPYKVPNEPGKKPMELKATWGNVNELNSFYCDEEEPQAWQSVKIEFTVNDNGESVSGTAYKLIDGAWEKENGTPITYDIEDKKFYATFLSALAGGSKEAELKAVYLDNIEISAIE